MIAICSRVLGLAALNSNEKVVDRTNFILCLTTSISWSQLNSQWCLISANSTFSNGSTFRLSGPPIPVQIVGFQTSLDEPLLSDGAAAWTWLTTCRLLTVAWCRGVAGLFWPNKKNLGVWQPRIFRGGHANLLMPPIRSANMMLRIKMPQRSLERLEHGWSAYGEGIAGVLASCRML